MKREIKFRVWDNVDFMSSPFTLQDLQEKKIQFTSDCAVMQYTGLKDKDGKEIYEGDIMEVDKSIFSVVWSDAAFAALSPGSEAIDWEHSGFFERSKRIGNIHEHKHLLK